MEEIFDEASFFQTFPIDFESFQRKIRSGSLGNIASNRLRVKIWPCLSHLEEGKTIESYPNVENLIYQQLKQDSKFFAYSMSMSLENADNQQNEQICLEKFTDSVENDLKNKKLIKETDLSRIDTLVKIIISVTEREDVSHFIAQDLLLKKEKYIDPSINGQFTMAYTFKKLLNKLMPKTYKVLTTLDALDEKYLKLMFSDFFIELYPSDIVLCMIDAFLLEGVKILYRYGLAIIKSYKKNVKSKKYKSGKDFWLAIKSAAVKTSREKGSIMLYNTLNINERLPKVDNQVIKTHVPKNETIDSSVITSQSFDEDRSALEKILKPLDLSKKRLSSLKEEARVKPKSIENYSPKVNRNKKKSFSDESEKLEGKLSIHLSSFSLSESFASSDDSLDGLIVEKERETVEESLSNMLVEFSSILDKNMAKILVSWLPESVISEGFNLVFNSNEHGWDLNVLYGLSENLFPSLILVQLMPPYENVVIGAFTLSKLSPPSDELRGDSDTFCFRLDSGNEHSFFTKEKSDLRLIPTDDTKEDTIYVDESKIFDLNNATDLKYVMASLECLSFGGDGTNEFPGALRLDKTLQNLTTGNTATFNNPPLLVPDIKNENSFNDFTVQSLELFCGKESVIIAENKDLIIKIPSGIAFEGVL